MKLITYYRAVFISCLLTFSLTQASHHVNYLRDPTESLHETIFLIRLLSKMKQMIVELENTGEMSAKTSLMNQKTKTLESSKKPKIDLSMKTSILMKENRFFK